MIHCSFIYRVSLWVGCILLVFRVAVNATTTTTTDTTRYDNFRGIFARTNSRVQYVFTESPSIFDGNEFPRIGTKKNCLSTNFRFENLSASTSICNFVRLLVWQKNTSTANGECFNDEIMGNHFPKCVDKLGIIEFRFCF